MCAQASGHLFAQLAVEYSKWQLFMSENELPFMENEIIKHVL